MPVIKAYVLMRIWVCLFLYKIELEVEFLSVTFTIDLYKNKLLLFRIILILTYQDNGSIAIIFMYIDNKIVYLGSSNYL